MEEHPEGLPACEPKAGQSHWPREWRDFVTSLDAAVILVFLIDDADCSSPTYFKALVPRIIETWGKDAVDGGHDSVSDLYLLELADDLNKGAPPEAFSYRARSLAVVAIHSALESYVDTVVQNKGPLPDRLRRGLSARVVDKKTQALVEAVTEFDATRHIIVHNHGTVDKRYIERVPSSEYRLGDRRPLPREQLLRYACTALSSGSNLRQIVESGPGRGGCESPPRVIGS